MRKNGQIILLILIEFKDKLILKFIKDWSGIR